MAMTIKIAEQPWEFEEVHRLNYRTFVEEIPQHHANAERRLVDKFHAENTYVIALQGRTLVGMVATRDRRPFSLDAKVPELDGYLPPHRRLCEVRLLAVEPGRRKGPILARLLGGVIEECLARGCDMAVISGTVRQQKLYRHIGFVPFGPLVGTPEAQYQPMVLSLDSLRAQLPWLTGPA